MRKYIFILTLLFATLYGIDFDQISSKPKDFQDSYLEFAQENSQNKKGELAFLELAKLEILNRNYEKSIQYLEKINSPEIHEKYYWLAKSCLETEKFHQAIISAQKFITEAKDVSKIEISYFLIAESYIKQEMFKRSLNTLEALRKSKYIGNNISLLHYKIGFCNEQMGKFEQALICYKKVKQDFAYTPMSYEAEERIAKITKTENLDSLKLKKLKEKKNIKFEAEKNMKIYLQVGAFSSNENAEHLKKRIVNFGFKVILFIKNKDNKKLYVVAVGPFNNNATLKKVSQKLKEENIDSFILKRY